MKCVCITWRGSLDDDVNRIVGQVSVKDFGELGGCLEFHFLGDLVQQEGLFIIIVVRNRYALEGEILGFQILKPRWLTEMDGVSKLPNSRWNCQ